jgi:hypothetical protein
VGGVSGGDRILVRRLRPASTSCSTPRCHDRLFALRFFVRRGPTCAPAARRDIILRARQTGRVSDAARTAVRDAVRASTALARLAELEKSWRADLQ